MSIPVGASHNSRNDRYSPLVAAFYPARRTAGVEPCGAESRIAAPPPSQPEHRQWMPRVRPKLPQLQLHETAVKAGVRPGREDCPDDAPRHSEHQDPLRHVDPVRPAEGFDQRPELAVV